MKVLLGSLQMMVVKDRSIGKPGSSLVAGRLACGKMPSFVAPRLLRSRLTMGTPADRSKAAMLHKKGLCAKNDEISDRRGASGYGSWGRSYYWICPPGMVDGVGQAKRLLQVVCLDIGDFMVLFSCYK